MIETSLILSLMLPSFLLAYLGMSIDERHSVMKMFLTSGSLVMALGSPLTAWQLAQNQNITVVQDYLIYFELAFIAVFVVFLFYWIWLYIKTTGKVISGTDEAFDEDNMGA